MDSFKLVDVSELTSTTIVQPPAGNSFFDVVARISGSTASSTASVSIVDTSVLLKKMSSYVYEAKRDVNILKGVVGWQHKLIDYNSSYTAFLMEQIDEEEFERVAAEFAELQVSCDSMHLSHDIERVHSLTGIDYSVMDYANMFGCTEDVVELAIKCIPSHSPGLRSWSEGVDE